MGRIKEKLGLRSVVGVTMATVYIAEENFFSHFSVNVT